MKFPAKEILSFKNLEIGYKSGKQRKILLPPLNGKALVGEMIAVIGKNGIGKSTLLKTITGIQEILAGDLLIKGINFYDYGRKQLASNLAYISTEIIRVSNMTVFDLVAQGRFLHTNWYGRIDSANRIAVMKSLARTGMTEFSDRRVNELSDGERQRAMIAMILAQETDLIIMDEPTAFLDINSKYEIIHLLKELSRKEQKSVIYSTHDFETAVSQADKIWLLLDNEFIEGAPEDIMLKGAFGSLFNSKVISLNEKNGTYSIKSDLRGNIFVSGKGKEEYWTRKALIRAGYKVGETSTGPLIEINKTSTIKWIFKNKGFSEGFETIYDLLCWLGKNEYLIF